MGSVTRGKSKNQQKLPVTKYPMHQPSGKRVPTVTSFLVINRCTRQTKVAVPLTLISKLRRFRPVSSGTLTQLLGMYLYTKHTSVLLVLVSSHAQVCEGCHLIQAHNAALCCASLFCTAQFTECLVKHTTSTRIVTNFISPTQT